MRYQCSVKQVHGDRVEVTYHSQGKESLAISIPIPKEKTPTPRWVEKKMREYSEQACKIWCDRDEQKEIANMVDDYNLTALNSCYVDEETGDSDVVEL